jgi:hypothetical protein
MPNLTRTGMRDELKAHGWSRFTDSQLDVYLDWALQETYSEGAFERSVYDTYLTTNFVKNNTIGFSQISGSNGEDVQQIRKVWVADPDGKDPRPLKPADRDYFWNVMRGTDQSHISEGAPAYYYAHDLQLFIFPIPNTAVSVIVDYLRRKDSFAGNSDTSGLPQRFDKIIIVWAEAFCHRRARELQEMVNAERQARDMMLRELGMEGMTMYEGHSRVVPWGG